MPKVKLKIEVKKIYSVRPIELLLARERAGLSQEHLAELMANEYGWSRKNISNIESSALQHLVDGDTLKKLEQIFELEYSQ